jgi:GNAT superfamily N-acetyltransferase
VIRRAGVNDLELLLEMSVEFNAVDQHPHDVERVRRALIPILQSDDQGVVYLIGDLVGGYAVVTWSYSIESGGRDALLDEIYVRTPGEGVGGAALDEILDELRTRGLPRIFLETERHNSEVRRFYARHGFVEEDSIWMARDLNSPRTTHHA